MNKGVQTGNGAGALVVGITVPIFLLAGPCIALQRCGVGLRWGGVYVIAMSLVAYWVYAVDKRRAQVGEWRVPEAWLHLLELLGGWPGAFLAQRRLRHKCSKVSYQVEFWLIVLAFQFAAFDSLQDWRFSRNAMEWISSKSDRRR
jgi:uncharacterized membrane protein YsdA (DUF1294 family)